MASASVGSDRDAVDAILMDRYPLIAFHLNFIYYQPYTLEQNRDGSCNAVRSGEDVTYLHNESIDQEIDAFLSKRNLDQVEILYLYGIGLGYHYNVLKSWLQQKRERLLIILEEDLGAISAFLQFDFAQEMLLDPHVHLCFIPDTQEIASLFQELAATFPSEHVELLAIASKKKNKRLLHKMQLQLYRISSVSQALMTEALYSHKLLDNLIQNTLKWPGSFLANGLKGQFKDVPAIICGAGPSLAKTFDELKQVGDRALIIAGGSTISALSNQGIIPHIGIAMDPNHEEFGRLKASSSYEMPLIYATRLQSDVFSTTNGPRGYLISETGGSCEAYLERAMGIEGEAIGPELGMEAFSVTTICIALAVEMGCNPIILNGIDLAYIGMQRYAAGVMPSSKIYLDEVKMTKRASERLVKRKDIQGNSVYTLIKWIMESQCISAYAKKHPECRFINATEAGLGFSRIPNQSLSTLLQTQLQETYDLQAALHAQFEHLQMRTCTGEKIRSVIQEITDSLNKLEEIVEQLLKEIERASEDTSIAFPTGKMTILEVDFQEEKAFTCLFASLGPALNRLLNRMYYLSPLLSEEEKRRMHIHRLRDKWTQFKQTIAAEKAFFSRY